MFDYWQKAVKRARMIPRDYFHGQSTFLIQIYLFAVFGERSRGLAQGSFLLLLPSHDNRRACTWLTSTRDTCTHARPTEQLSVGLATSEGVGKMGKILRNRPDRAFIRHAVVYRATLASTSARAPPWRDYGDICRSRGGNYVETGLTRFKKIGRGRNLRNNEKNSKGYSSPHSRTVLLSNRYCWIIKRKSLLHTFAIFV